MSGQQGKRKHKPKVAMDREVMRLYDLDYGPGAISEELAAQYGEEIGYSEKTVRDVIKAQLARRRGEEDPSSTNPTDESEPWSFADADAEEARLVRDVVLGLAAGTGGRMWLTKDLAAWVAKLRTTSEAIPPDVAYMFALGYEHCTRHDRDTRGLDLLLALKGWESPEVFDRSIERIAQCIPGFHPRPRKVGGRFLPPWQIALLALIGID